MDLIIFALLLILIFMLVNLWKDLHSPRDVPESDFEISMLKDDIKRMQQEMDQMRTDACRDRIHTKNIIHKTLNCLQKNVAKVNDLYESLNETKESLKITDQIKSGIFDEVFKEIPERYDELRSEMYELRDECKEQMDDVIRKQIKLMQLLMGNQGPDYDGLITSPEQRPPPYTECNSGPWANDSDSDSD